MKLADKPCYPNNDEIWNQGQSERGGLTFKERLVVALASNSTIVRSTHRVSLSKTDCEENAKDVIYQANAIIAELEKEK